jgi:hypothetical protein
MPRGWRGVAWTGELTAVWVLDEKNEALRDLVRVREAAKQDQLRHRHQVGELSAAARLASHCSGGKVDEEISERDRGSRTL